VGVERRRATVTQFVRDFYERPSVARGENELGSHSASSSSRFQSDACAAANDDHRLIEQF
jgi:hypothetical protein